MDQVEGGGQLTAEEPSMSALQHMPLPEVESVLQSLPLVQTPAISYASSAATPFFLFLC